MLDKFLTLGKHTIIYGIGSALTAIGSFILIPLYTHMFAPSEFGILELLNRTADILIVLIMMGVRQAFIRYYFEEDSEEWHKKVVASTTAFVLVSSVAFLSIFYPFRDQMAEWIIKDPLSGFLFLYIIVWIPLEIMVRVGLTYLQIQMKSATYVIINFIKFAFFIGSNIILIYYFEMGIEGVLITNVWVNAVIGAAFLLYFIYWTKFKISMPLIKDMLKFGLPYLPTAFFGFIMNTGDRYFLSIYSSLDEVGIYALGAKIGTFGIYLVIEPFGKVWAPFLFENYNKDDGPRLLSKVFTLKFLITVTVGLCIAMGAPIVIPIISDKAYFDSFKLVPIICLAAVFYDMAGMADAGILISKKTGYKPLIFGLTAIVAVISFFLLIPPFGAMGAAVAMVITDFALFVINYKISNKFYYIKIEWSKMMIILATAVVFYLVFLSIWRIDPDDITIQILSLSIIIFYPLVLWISRLLSVEEKEMIMKLRSVKSKK